MAVLVAAAGGAALAASGVPEAQVKAEYLERFTRYVSWPPNTFASGDAPFVMCVMGDNPFGDYLNKIAKERRALGRKIAIVRVVETSRLEPCHLLFVARSEDKRLEKILAQTADLPMLTISDTVGFGARGVLINFYRDGETLKFEINVRAVKRSGLVISSKLLRLVSPGRLLGKAP